MLMVELKGCPRFLKEDVLLMDLNYAQRKNRIFYGCLLALMLVFTTSGTTRSIWHHAQRSI